MTVKKSGKLSREAMEFIREHASVMAVETIADEIGKSVATVERFIFKNNLVKKADTSEEKTKARLRKTLHDREYWDTIKANFTKSEIKTFEDTWISLYRQFDEDVQPTEELQIQKYITLYILRQRAIAKQNQYEMMIADISVILEREKFNPEANKAMLAKLSENIIALTSESKEVNKEIRSYIDQESKLESSLKGTRDQRIKQISDANKNLSSILHMLENTNVRRDLGKHIELMREASLKEKRRISQPHQFLDKSIDLPLLSHETVGNLYTQEDEEEDEE